MDKIYCLSEAAKFVDTYTIQCSNCKIFCFVDPKKSWINCSGCNNHLTVQRVYESLNPIPVFEQIEPKWDAINSDEYFVEGILNHCVCVDEKNEEKWFFRIKSYNSNDIIWEPLKNVIHLDLFNEYMQKCELDGKKFSMILRGHISIK